MRTFPVFCISLLIIATPLATAQATTAFTYQGRLDESGQPQNGTVGLVFELYDAASGGSQVGPTLNRSVDVSDGLFQTELDFGDQLYRDPLWLKIDVNGVALEPRQRLVAVPLAVRAGQAESARQLAGECPTMDPDDEMIRVGALCIDKYEASIWDSPVGGNQITGALPCSADGQDCDNIYARSVPGVAPAENMTWSSGDSIPISFRNQSFEAVAQSEMG